MSLSLDKARGWFEERFDEVHVYNAATHPGIAPYLSPTGHSYLTVAGGVLHLEGDEIERSETPVEDWFEAACRLWELMGRPKYLWWRTVPELGNGSVYSRLMMTNYGPYQSYTGEPIMKKFTTTVGRTRSPTAERERVTEAPTTRGQKVDPSVTLGPLQGEPHGYVDINSPAYTGKFK